MIGDGNTPDIFLRENVTPTAPSWPAATHGVGGPTLPPGGFDVNGQESAGLWTVYEIDASVDRSGLGAWMRIDLPFDTFVFAESYNNNVAPSTTTGRGDDLLQVTTDEPSIQMPPNRNLRPGRGINQFGATSIWIRNWPIATVTFQLWFIKDARRRRSSVAET